MNTIKRWISFLTAVILIVLLLYKFVFFVVVVPSASMYPAIEIGDRIITSRIHNYSSIERGDILVFYSEEFRETMIKRVIGLPDDLVEINKNGEVFVNNKKLDEPYVKYPDNLSGSFSVPEGKYFFLGDFRIHSMDSRKWKEPFISEDKILGKAKLIIFPLDRIKIINSEE
ncbi:signal peptidase I [Tissierella sp.]|uniref:signal peptidase I n=1 Tax=Tissierella sp. TaxID=41274 RepID=UPI00285E5E51|nr:signal peptidase I [Tissierella sp.]MDR7855242.1 signal peptidase I [Tissierella sp.]